MSIQEKQLLQLSEKDNVAVALKELSSGEAPSAGGRAVPLSEDIPFGHKVALEDIAEGQDIVKYGHPIGHAACAIKAGQHVHTHNLKTNLGGIETYEYYPAVPELEPPAKEYVFQGYRRPDGSVGTRNEVWIIPTVGCVGRTAARLEEMAREVFAGRCDGVYAFPHNMGCSQLGEDQETTQKLLAGLINNPNAGAVLVLGLGCENNHIGVFRPFVGEQPEGRVEYLVTQEVSDEYAAGMEALERLVSYAGRFRREPVPVSELVVGFKCGGSDAFSGITANALCGRVNDAIAGAGGSTVLTEVPEMFGAETLLMERAVDHGVFDKVVGLINDYKGYFMKYGQTIYENPSPGNKKGGISTLEDKSLGCVQKGGRAPVVDVLGYGQRVTAKGLNLLTGSGNDQMSCTNLTASGATVILFTTGRGNPYGSPVPTLKISSNTVLYDNKPHWIDYNAGCVLADKTFPEAAEELMDLIVSIASGDKTARNEENGYREISIFRDGVIL